MAYRTAQTLTPSLSWVCSEERGEAFHLIISGNPHVSVVPSSLTATKYSFLLRRNTLSADLFHLSPVLSATMANSPTSLNSIPDLLQQWQIDLKENYKTTEIGIV